MRSPPLWGGGGGGGALDAAAGVTDADGVLTFDTPDGDIAYSQPLGADVRKVVKVGDGTLTLATPSPDFPADSTVEVLKGTLTLKHADVFGPSLGVAADAIAPIVIKEGATLFLNLPARADGTENTYPIFANHPITVGGDGVGGAGAIRFVPHTAVDSPDGTAVFDLGGHTLTLAGSQSVFLHNMTLRHGKVRINAQTSLVAEARGNYLDPDSPGEILLNGGILKFNSVPTTDGWGRNWKIVFEQSSTLAGNVSVNGFAGDVVLADATNTIDVKTGGRLAFNGGVYGGRMTLLGGDPKTPETGTVAFNDATVSNDVMVSRGVGATFTGGILDIDRFDVGTPGSFLNGATNVFCGGVRVNVRQKESAYWQVESINQLGALVFSNGTVSAGGSTTKMIRLGGRLVHGPNTSPLLGLRTVGYGEYALLGGEFVCEQAGGELALSASGA